MKLAPNYIYDITHIQGSKYKIELSKKGSDKVKTFIVVSHRLEGLISHMESLSETICNDFMKGV